MATLSIRHVDKVYPTMHRSPTNKSKTNLKIVENGVLAVDNFNLEIKDKEFIVLVGPSGCGKSTMLRMVAGLEKITKGEIYIDEVLVNDMEPRDRDIAMVFQNYALYPHMTVKENLEYPLKLHKVPKEEMNQKVLEAAEILGITQYLDRKPAALSGGQRQRVAIGRAIVREPKVLLMDEPLSNLDAKLRNQMRAELIELRERINTTFIYVTHDQTEAMTLGDRIVIMKDGEVMQVGTPDEVYEHPRNMFVAGFIGVPQMNFFNGNLIKKENSYEVHLQDKVIHLSEEKITNLKKNDVDSGEVIVGIRPEHMSIHSDAETKMKATVNVCETMGSSIHVHFSALDTTGVVIVKTAELDEGVVINPKDEIELGIDGSVVQIFDKDGINLEFKSKE